MACDILSATDPCIEIYTLGDLMSMRAALNGVAMIFNSSNNSIWTSAVSGDNIGLGAGVAVGLLVSLMIMLFKSIPTQKFDVGGLIMMIMLYSLMFVPKMSLQVYDVYSGAVIKVANLPLGVALPAGIVSNLTREVTSKLEIAFSTTNGNYMTLNGEGFLSPLKLLNAYRPKKVSSQIQKMEPELLSTLRAYVIWCYVGRSGASHQAVMNSNDPVSKILSVATNGLTQIYTRANPNGKGATCTDARTHLQGILDPASGTFYNSVYSGTNNPSGLTAYEIILNTAATDPKKTQATGVPQKFNDTDVDAALNALTGGTALKAFEMAQISLFAPAINDSFRCSAAASQQDRFVECIASVQATNQYREDAAAAGTFFQRIMIHGMNIMLFLFYVFAPVIALVIVFMGPGGFKVAGNYLLFGVWTQTWLPVATMINFYLQVQVQNETARWSMDVTNPVFNMRTADSFYQMLADKIALGGDMMSAVPIISLALMSGSMTAMSSVASRWGGKDNYDEKINNPSAIQGGSLATTAPAQVGTYGMKNVSSNGLDSASTLTMTSNAQRQATQTLTSANLSALTLGRSTQETLNRLASDKTDQGRQLYSKVSEGATQDRAYSEQLTQANGLSKIQNTAVKTAMSKALEDSAGGGIGVSTPISIGGKWSVKTSDNKSHEISEAEAKTINDMQTTASGITATRKSGMETGQLNSYVKTVSSTLGRNLSKTGLEDLKRTESLVEQSAVAETAAQGTQKSHQITGAGYIGAMQKNPELAQQHRDLYNAITANGTNNHAPAIAALARSQANTAQFANSPDQAADYATMLYATQMQGKGVLPPSADAAYGNVVSGLTGDAPMAPPSLKPLDNSKVAADASKIKPPPALTDADVKKIRNIGTPQNNVAGVGAVDSFHGRNVSQVEAATVKNREQLSTARAEVVQETQNRSANLNNAGVKLNALMNDTTMREDISEFNGVAIAGVTNLANMVLHSGKSWVASATGAAPPAFDPRLGEKVAADLTQYTGQPGAVGRYVRESIAANRGDGSMYKDATSPTELKAIYNAQGGDAGHMSRVEMSRELRKASQNIEDPKERGMAIKRLDAFDAQNAMLSRFKDDTTSKYGFDKSLDINHSEIPR